MNFSFSEGPCFLGVDFWSPSSESELVSRLRGWICAQDCRLAEEGAATLFVWFFWGIFFWTDLLNWRFLGIFFGNLWAFLGSLLRVNMLISLQKNRVVYRFTLPETIELHLKMLKMAGWNTKFLLGWPIFGGELLFLRSVLILLAGVHPNFVSFVFRSLVGEGVPSKSCYFCSYLEKRCKLTI